MAWSKSNVMIKWIKEWMGNGFGSFKVATGFVARPPPPLFAHHLFTKLLDKVNRRCVFIGLEMAIKCFLM